MLIFLLLLRIAQFITWRQFIVIGAFEFLSIIYKELRTAPIIDDNGGRHDEN